MMRDSFLDGDLVQDRLDVWCARLNTPAPNQHIVVTEEDGALYGFICVYGDDDSEWGSLIDNLHVRQAHQKRGTGRTLMGEAAAWLDLRYPGFGVYLWVMQANINAQQFYERLGGTNREAAVTENATRGDAHVFRYAWDGPGALLT